MLKAHGQRAYRRGCTCDAEGVAYTRGDHIFSIITCPNPEQLTWVAPSIRRAKS
jgi:hypothetical protein